MDEVNPILLKFLEAEASSDKLRIIQDNGESLDDRALNNIEASLDVVSNSTDPEERINYICDILRTRAKFETGRLR
ncbi:MAG: hypothetical protein IKZ73_03160 [Lachnospiraceae bacterium]|nr:hypothetical protein [Lachnospiraceae bacterium]